MRPALSTRAQRERVFALAEKGTSVRAITLDIFGSARYKDRVQRLLMAGRARVLVPDDPGALDALVRDYGAGH